MTSLADEIRKPLRLGLVAAIVIAVLGVSLIVWNSLRPDEPAQEASSSALQRQEAGDSMSDGQSPSGDMDAPDESDNLTGPPDAPGGPSGIAEQSPLIAVFGVERYGETSRPDAVAVVGVEKQTANPLVISLEPDQSLGEVGSIASMYAEFGPEAVALFVGELLSLPLTQYVVLDYQVFESIVDRLGGVEVEVKEYIGVRSADGSLVTVQPGTHSLNGKEALAYIRYKWAGDERARLARQAEFLKGLRSRLSERSTISVLPSLIRDAFALIKTNVSLSSAVGVVESLRWSDMDRYRLIVITDEARGDDGFTSYWTPADFVRSAVGLDGAERVR